jgi:tRNA(Leu) C34 or U34 (ribose-2'-O)-methylase TrmL
MPTEQRVARRPFVVTNGSTLRGLSGPAVVLVDPKNLVNVASMIRNCAAFGVNTLCYTGDRVDLPSGRKGDRLPREERMRDYDTVQVVHHDFPLRLFKPDVVPIGVEIMPGTVPLPYFEHPYHGVYVFGPEDGSLPTGIRAVCHDFVQIPSMHCLNLAQAGGIVLYERMVSRWRQGEGDLFHLARQR